MRIKESGAQAGRRAGNRHSPLNTESSLFFFLARSAARPAAVCIRKRARRSGPSERVCVPGCNAAWNIKNYCALLQWDQRERRGMASSESAAALSPLKMHAAAPCNEVVLPPLSPLCHNLKRLCWGITVYFDATTKRKYQFLVVKACDAIYSALGAFVWAPFLF